MNTPITTKYRCSQSELYSVVRTGWASFEERLSIFTSKKSYYNAAYLAAAIAEYEAAMALPDFAARQAIQSTLRVQLLALLQNGVTFWQLIKSHIVKAYPEELVDIKLSAAGSSYYAGAVNKDWEVAVSLFSSGFNFMVDNEADLVANNNMPSTFTADYTDAKNDFNSAYLAFKNSESAMAAINEAKRNANNAIYKKMMAMFKDGAVYFKNDPVIKQSFIFKGVLAIVSSPGPAGLTGTITNAANAPVSGAVLSLFDGTNTSGTARYTTTANADGSYDFGNIAGAHYTLKIEHATFVTRLEPVTIATGVSSTKNFILATA